MSATSAECVYPSGPVRILAYHGVHPEVVDRITITVEQFARQMAVLEQGGRKGVALDTWCAELRRTGTVPASWVVLTFDDGYRDCLRHVAPILRRHGFAATVFVIADALQAGRSIANCHPAKEFLAAAEVEELQRDGWEIGSHTLSHRRLTAIAPAEQQREIRESKDVLEQRFSRRVESFCYPGGQWDDGILAAVQEHGYLQATVTPRWAGALRPGSWHTLERAGVYPGNGDWGFRFKLTTAYRRIRPLALAWRRRTLTQ